MLMGDHGIDSDEEEVANPLIVKLKLKKNVGEHVCKVCKKEFTCGKALGGHMRIHNEEIKGGKQHKAVVVRGGDKEVEDLSSSTCKLCYKEFPSMKSLFGHMRCHPEREWRGINPPPSYPLPPPPPPPPPPPRPPLKNSSSSTLSETALAQTDSGEEHGFRGDGSSLKNWPVTARRARLGNSPTTSLFDTAVEALCMLSRGETLNNKKGAEEDDGDYSGYSLAAMYESGNESDGKSKINKSEIGRPCRIESNQNQTLSKKATKKRKLSALSGNGRYKCSTCHKSFHSHRALGGHRAGHKKNKNHHDPSDEEGEFVVELAAAAADEATGAETAATTAAVHRCEVCEKTFRSGQALGGHKRRHRVKLAEAASSSSTASPEEKKAEGAGGRVMEFDLNEPPPME